MNSDFMYEQVMAPPALRKFFIPLSLIVEGAYVSVAWCEKVKSLLNGISISSSMHYVARAYAPFTYAQILNMAMSINVPMPLIFLADKNQYHSSKTVEAIELSGGFYALVFNQSLIAKRSEEQLQALVARELARIGQMRTKNYAVFYRAAQYAVAGVCCASAYTFFSAEWMKTHGLTLALIAGGCIASLVVAKKIDRTFSATGNQETESVAATAFGGDVDAYNEYIASIQADETARANRREFHYHGYLSMLLKKIDEVAHLISPFALCFLKNELMYFSQITMKKPTGL